MIHWLIKRLCGTGGTGTGLNRVNLCVGKWCCIQEGPMMRGVRVTSNCFCISKASETKAVINFTKCACETLGLTLGFVLMVRNGL